ncbi:hypothetical protein T439DRAFT_380093 [Meredithblackwellia eburnea MCA 4105]
MASSSHRQSNKLEPEAPDDEQNLELFLHPSAWGQPAEALSSSPQVPSGPPEISESSKSAHGVDPQDRQILDSLIYPKKDNHQSIPLGTILYWLRCKADELGKSVPFSQVNQFKEWLGSVYWDIPLRKVPERWKAICFVTTFNPEEAKWVQKLLSGRVKPTSACYNGFLDAHHKAHEDQNKASSNDKTIKKSLTSLHAQLRSDPKLRALLKVKAGGALETIIIHQPAGSERSLPRSNVFIPMSRELRARLGQIAV